ncbi:predicted protein [Plenodomus lingam JN3]|uniref:Predicted protein n=1 Tax=Leptosphaeria maculans (strain JN3 / isolate v23.1.3 / race Av1-4-5-6-7-8) TaxID=985895 RepID=E5ACI2_LEPMJ|nr:predicted protein [Plenodomus lingam JN3]CBY02184.1 predicted protein [Plenodomus lingam JN3]
MLFTKATLGDLNPQCLGPPKRDVQGAGSLGAQTGWGQWGMGSMGSRARMLVGIRAVNMNHLGRAIHGAGPLSLHPLWSTSNESGWMAFSSSAWAGFLSEYKVLVDKLVAKPCQLTAHELREPGSKHHLEGCWTACCNPPGQRHSWRAWRHVG